MWLELAYAGRFFTAMAWLAIIALWVFTNRLGFEAVIWGWGCCMAGDWIHNYPAATPIKRP